MKYFFAILLSVFLVSALLAQNVEETAIKQTIEDEIHHFYQRDFDNWSSLWMHSPNAYLSFSEPNSNQELKGWEEISTWHKDFFTRNSNPVSDAQEYVNYQYTLNGDMAFVTFENEARHSTRVLQKIDGQWKILQAGVINTQAYEREARVTGIKQLIENVQGSWQLDPESIEERSSYLKIKGFDVGITPERTGMTLEGYLSVIFPNGNPGKEWNQIQFHFANDPKIALVIYNWSWVNSPATVISSGKCEVIDGEKIVGKLTNIAGETPYAKLTIHFKSNDRFRIDWSLLNDKGEERWGLACDLIKKGI